MNSTSGGGARRRRIPFLAVLLGMIIVLFLSILAYTYLETRRADPVILDEKGLRR